MGRIKIENRNDLLAEIGRLKNLSALQEERIREDARLIQENLRPVNVLRNLFSSITGIKTGQDDFRRTSLIGFILFALRKVISKAESKTEDRVYEFMDRAFNRIRDFLSKYFHVRRSREEKDAE